jgi:NAD(P)-dependent dehydrogenase (short-subunit alcohol dehydrogenase family)
MSNNPKLRLEGKACIVTGAGMHDGIVGTGTATALSLAREGAKVLVADVSEENATKTVQQIRDDKIGQAEIFLGDATRTEDSEAMIAAALKYFGRLDVLVNNLGYGGKSVNRNKGKRSRGGISEIDEQEWADAFDINLNSAMLASRYAIPKMAETGGGSIINVSSCDGISSADHYGAPYSVSKGALHMLTRGTAAWHGREGIRANCIAPGHLHSAFTEHFEPEHRERRKQVVPLGTEGTPWDVAMAAVFLASDESRWISGIILPVDGGLFAAQPMLAHDFITGQNPK